MKIIWITVSNILPFVLQQWVMAEGRKGQIIIGNATLGLYIQNQKENIGSWTIWLFLAY